MLKKLDENEFTKVFGKKIWLTPSDPRDEYLGHYGVHWGAGNNEFFWNHYFMNLDLDSNNDIVNFNFSSNIACSRAIEEFAGIIRQNEKEKSTK